MTRLFDFIFSLIGLVLLSPIILLLIIVCYFDTGSPIFVQERMGRAQRIFKLYKFRSMVRSTEQVATHLASVTNITPWGKFLRKSKLDEIPQLFNVLKGEMSLVGPRPNLFSQVELAEYRTAQNVYTVRPGITGEAQIKNIDMSTPELLAKTDANMISQMNLLLYFKLIVLTLLGRGGGDPIQSGKG
jgi:O-antigen biosynthesis protein WbqP